VFGPECLFSLVGKSGRHEALWETRVEVNDGLLRFSVLFCLFSLDAGTVSVGNVVIIDIIALF
jgi:hypothetical protein